jgi:cobalt-zinc-cadmium efflux system membrane fusion protein
MKINMRFSQSFTLAVFGLSACATFFPGCAKRETAKEPEAALAPKIQGDKIVFETNAPQLGYLVVEPAQDRKAVATKLSGRLAWDDDVTARVFPPVSGRIIEILANPSQRVAAGDVLARIKSPDFGQAQADARKSAADFTLAERSLARARELLAHRAAAQKDVESAEADYARAESENERARATLSLYGSDREATEVNGLFSLKAPVAGVVVEKSVSPGQEVRSDQVGDKPLFVISDPTRLWLFLDVSEADAGTLTPGQEVLIRARGLPDTVFHGRLEIIAEGLDPATRTVKARCIVENPDKRLRAETYVNADMVPTTAAGVDLPTKALFLKDNQHYLYVETASGQFERRAVSLGQENNGRSVVVNGLSAGQRVVTEGSLLLEALLEGENS